MVKLYSLKVIYFFSLDGTPDTGAKRLFKTEPLPLQVPEMEIEEEEVIEDMSPQLDQAALILQKNWKAHNKRKEFKEKANGDTFETILTRTIDKPLEKKLAKKGINKYYVLMMYNWDEAYISIQVKNFETKKFYKTVTKYQTKNDLKNGKKKVLEELKTECEKLLERLSILDGCLVLLEEPKKNGNNFSF